MLLTTVLMVSLCICGIVCLIMSVWVPILLEVIRALMKIL